MISFELVALSIVLEYIVSSKYSGITSNLVVINPAEVLKQPLEFQPV